MPNCSWFGTKDDHALVLKSIFADEDVEVFNSYSHPNQKLRAFTDPDQVLSIFDTCEIGQPPSVSVHLMLWVRGSGPGPEISRFELNSKSSLGSWRESCGPMGCVAIHLETLRDNSRLNYSSANAVSEARMGAVSGLFTGQAGEVWNMRETNRKSSALNRFIRKHSVGKINAIAVLPGAAELWHKGRALWSWSKATTPEVFMTT